MDINADKLAPASLGGGIWNDGIQRLNFPLVHQNDPNQAINGFPSASAFWPSTVALAENQWNTAWRRNFNSENPLELLSDRGILRVIPGTDWTAPSEPSNITTSRAQLRTLITSSGWRMIYAADDAEFDRIWQEMRGRLNDFGYQEVLTYDMRLARELATAIQQVLRR